MHIIRQWYKRYFSDPQVVILILFLLGGTVTILTMGKTLAPVLASLVIAYLLEGLVGLLEKSHVPRLAAVLIVFLTFLTFLLILLVWLLPLLSGQLAQLVGQLPSMIARWQKQMMLLPERYPDYISHDLVANLINMLQTELGHYGQRLLAVSVASFRGLITSLVYLVLMPLMVFFFLKDKNRILHWFSRFLPDNRALSSQVLQEMNLQIGNYTRGKFWEILIVWSASYMTFYFLDLNFAMLISLMVGLSVLVPYIGATVVAFPVVLMGFFQFGWSPDFMWVAVSYAIIQLLDGNLLAPLLLSEVVNLHPVAIITAILVFGGLWGFWGVFFAIPLATLVQAVLRAWFHQTRKLIRIPGDPPDEDQGDE